MRKGSEGGSLPADTTHYNYLIMKILWGDCPQLELWHSALRHYLKCPHHTQRVNLSPAVLPLIHLLDYVLTEGSSRLSKYLAPDTHVGEQDGVPGSWI